MGLNANTLDTCFINFKLDYAKTKSLATGKSIVIENVSFGGLAWYVVCFPRGSHQDPSNNGEYLSLRVVIRDTTAKAIFHAFVMGRDGAPSLSHPNSSSKVIYASAGTSSGLVGGWHKFMKRSDLESDYLIDGCITFICGITILPDDRSISVPASDLGNHLGSLLDSAEGSDVSFSIDGEIFHAHRYVLAARSPVFKAQLLGNMADAKMACITLHDIQPATFGALLRYMYTDALPMDDNELEYSSSATELLQHLLAAADMYQLDRLKLVCAKKLCNHVSIENVSTMLGCTATHNCPELKNSSVFGLRHEVVRNHPNQCPNLTRSFGLRHGLTSSVARRLPVAFAEELRQRILRTTPFPEKSPDEPMHLEGRTSAFCTISCPKPNAL